MHSSIRGSFQLLYSYNIILTIQISPLNCEHTDNSCIAAARVVCQPFLSFERKSQRHYILVFFPNIETNRHHRNECYLFTTWMLDKKKHIIDSNAFEITSNRFNFRFSYLNLSLIFIILCVETYVGICIIQFVLPIL